MYKNAIQSVVARYGEDLTLNLLRKEVNKMSLRSGTRQMVMELLQMLEGFYSETESVMQYVEEDPVFTLLRGQYLPSHFFHPMQAVLFHAFCRGRTHGDPPRVTTLHLAPAAPGTPAQITTAWCGEQTGLGLPMVSTVDGRNESVVWVVGAEGDNGVHAFNGETGEPLVTVAAPDAMTFVRRFQTLIIARGRLLVAADARLYALAPAP